MQFLCISDHFSNEDVKRNYRNLTCCPIVSVIGHPIMAYLIWAMFGETAWDNDSASGYTILVVTTVMDIGCAVLSVFIVLFMVIALKKISHLHAKRSFIGSIFSLLLELLTLGLFVTTFALLAEEFKEFIICGMIIILGLLRTGCTICSLGTFKRYMQIINPKKSFSKNTLHQKHSQIHPGPHPGRHQGQHPTERHHRTGANIISPSPSPSKHIPSTRHVSPSPASPSKPHK